MTLQKKITVRLTPGRVVVDPVTDENLPDEDITVDDSPYWRCRLADGDVTIAKASKRKQTEQAVPPAPSIASEK